MNYITEIDTIKDFIYTRTKNHHVLKYIDNDIVEDDDKIVLLFFIVCKAHEVLINFSINKIIDDLKYTYKDILKTDCFIDGRNIGLMLTIEKKDLIKLNEPDPYQDWEEWNEEVNEEYDYENNKFEVGDKVMCVELSDENEFNIHEIGEIDTIKEIALYGSLRFNKSLYIHVSAKRYKLVEDNPDPYQDWEEWNERTNEEYDYENNKFEVGDKVMCVELSNENKFNIHEIGEIDTIKGIALYGSLRFNKSLYIHVSAKRYKLVEDNPDPYQDWEEWNERTNEEYDYENNKFEVGDKVMCVELSDENKFNIHEIGEIDTIKGISLFGSVNFNKNLRIHVSTERYKLVEDNPDQYQDWEEWEDDWEDVNEEYDYENNMFEVGDKVRCIELSDDDYYNIHHIGEIATIKKLDFSGHFKSNPERHPWISLKRYKLVEDNPDPYQDWEEWNERVNEEYDYDKNRFEIGDLVKIDPKYKNEDFFKNNLDYFDITFKIVDFFSNKGLILVVDEKTNGIIIDDQGIAKTYSPLIPSHYFYLYDPNPYRDWEDWDEDWENNIKESIDDNKDNYEPWDYDDGFGNFNIPEIGDRVKLNSKQKNLDNLPVKIKKFITDNKKNTFTIRNVKVNKDNKYIIDIGIYNEDKVFLLKFNRFYITKKQDVSENVHYKFTKKFLNHENNEENYDESSKFKIGDIVITSETSEEKIRNSIGKVLYHDKKTNIYLIDFFKRDDLLPNLLLDIRSKSKHSLWWVGYGDLNLYNRDPYQDWETWSEGVNEEYNRDKNIFEIDDLVIINPILKYSKIPFYMNNPHVFDIVFKVIKIIISQRDEKNPFVRLVNINNEHIKVDYNLLDHIQLASNRLLLYYPDPYSDWEDWEEDVNEEYNRDKNEFEIGDIVEINGTMDGVKFNKNVGEIIGIEREYDLYDIRFLETVVDNITRWFVRAKNITKLHEPDPYSDWEEWDENINEEYDYEKDKFQVDDVVIVYSPNYHIINEIGIIKAISPRFRQNLYVVEFNKPVNEITKGRHQGHDGFWLRAGRDGYCWNLDKDEVTLYKPNPYSDWEDWDEGVNEEYDYVNNKFEVGDKVRCIKLSVMDKKFNIHEIGEIDTIKHIDDMGCLGFSKSSLYLTADRYKLVVDNSDPYQDWEDWDESVNEEYDYVNNKFEIGDKVTLSKLRETELKLNSSFYVYNEHLFYIIGEIIDTRGDQIWVIYDKDVEIFTFTGIKTDTNIINLSTNKFDLVNDNPDPYQDWEEWDINNENVNEEYDHDKNKFQIGDLVIINPELKNSGIDLYTKNPHLFDMVFKVIYIFRDDIIRVTDVDKNVVVCFNMIKKHIQLRMHRFLLYNPHKYQDWEEWNENEDENVNEKNDIKNIDDNDGILIVVDVQEEFKDYIPTDFEKNLSKYCDDFPIDGNRGVYQIWDSNKAENPTYKFPNQIDVIEKNYGTKFDENIISLVSKIEKKYDNIQEGQLFKIKDKEEYIVKVDNNHDWFFINNNLVNFFKKIKGLNVIVVGGADGECIKDVYVALKSFNINPIYNHDYIYSSETSEEDISKPKD